MTVALLAVLAACSGGADTDSGGPSGTWPVASLPVCDAPSGPDCVERVAWDDACAADPAPVLRDDLVFEGVLGDAHADPAVQAVTDEAAWTALLDGRPAERAVDFATEQVVILRHALGSCGARITQNGVGSDGSVRMAIEDSSGACDDVCDMDVALGVAYAIPADDPVLGCIAVVNVCAE